MEVANRTMVEHFINAAKGITNSILIIMANQKYTTYNYPVYSDSIPEKGPLGGIYTGLLKSRTEKNLILSCDSPYIESKMLNYIVENSSECDLTIGTTEGKSQPLLGVYSKSCIPIIEKQLSENKLKISDLFEIVKTKLLPLDEFDSKNFLNLNSPSDL